MLKEQFEIVCVLWKKEEEVVVHRRWVSEGSAFSDRIVREK